jgi:hypothetical protein
MYQKEKLLRDSWVSLSRVSHPYRTNRVVLLIIELLKINHYKAPRDKMICILNCCKVIFGMCLHSGLADR